MLLGHIKNTTFGRLLKGTANQVSRKQFSPPSGSLERSGRRDYIGSQLANAIATAVAPSRISLQVAIYRYFGHSFCSLARSVLPPSHVMHAFETLAIHCEHVKKWTPPERLDELPPSLCCSLLHAPCLCRWWKSGPRSSRSTCELVAVVHRKKAHSISTQQSRRYWL